MDPAVSFQSGRSSRVKLAAGLRLTDYKEERMKIIPVKRGRRRLLLRLFP
jgi:hypothetical protein